MPKIAITTMPRSGSSYYAKLLRMMYTEVNPGRSREGEWSQDDSWVIKVHEPILLLANVPEMVQTMILRNPVDNVASIVNKSSYGFGASTIIGRPEIVEDNIKRLLDDKQKWINEAIFQELHMWMGYTYNMMKNIDNIIPYTFEQLVEKENEVLTSFTYEIGQENLVEIPTVDSIKNEKNNWSQELLHDINHSSGSANLLPIKKSEMYEEIKNSVISNKYIDEAWSMYKEAIGLIETRQSKYKVPLAGIEPATLGLEVQRSVH